MFDSFLLQEVLYYGTCILAATITTKDQCAFAGFSFGTRDEDPEVVCNLGFELHTGHLDVMRLVICKGDKILESFDGFGGEFATDIGEDASKDLLSARLRGFVDFAACLLALEAGFARWDVGGTGCDLHPPDHAFLDHA
jgi:hypothetical protein